MKLKLFALALLSCAVGASAFFFDWGIGVAPFSNVTVDGTSLNGEDEFDRTIPAFSSQLHIGGNLNEKFVLALESNSWLHGYECDYYDMTTYMVAIGPALFFYPMPKLAFSASVGYSMTINTFDYGTLFEYWGYEDEASDLFSGIMFSVGGFYDFMESGPGVSIGLLFMHSANKIESGWERNYGLEIAVKFTYKSQPVRAADPRPAFNKTEAYKPLEQSRPEPPTTFGGESSPEPAEETPQSASEDDGWDSDW